ncbi:MAG TPA: hypothetical protein VKV19_13115 [Ktedonobacteraceae bacterium]|nr:hypothetical protein [Ktedonobacteraceae bacterium]
MVQTTKTIDILEKEGLIPHERVHLENRAILVSDTGTGVPYHALSGAGRGTSKGENQG